MKRDDGLALRLRQMRCEQNINNTHLNSSQVSNFWVVFTGSSQIVDVQNRTGRDALSIPTQFDEI